MFYSVNSMRIINNSVSSFEKGKTYIFFAETIEAKNAHKWADIIDGQIVNVVQPQLGFITMFREGRKPKEMPVLPKFCYEVEY